MCPLLVIPVLTGIQEDGTGSRRLPRTPDRVRGRL